MKSRMLRAALICPDDRLNHELEIALPTVADLEIVRVLTRYPSPDELLRTIRVRKVDAVLLNVDESERAEALAKFLDDTMPGFPVITLSIRHGEEILERLMHLGVREHLTSPIAASKLAEAVASAGRRLITHPVYPPAPGDLFTFLSAKPGVGASTLALSTSCALAEELNVRTLLLDADLATGTIQFLLKLGASASLVDALLHGPNLDEDLWLQMVAKWGKLDVLHAGALNTPPGMPVPGVEQVLAMARAQYDVVCADLGSQFDPLTVALLTESRRILLVTTKELASLHLAKVRMRRLIQLGVGDRVSLLLNRKTKSVVTDAEVESTVGIPVSHNFSNDYRAVQQSILRASPVQPRSALGESIMNLAQSLTARPEAKPVPLPRKFLQFFHVPHTDEAVS